MWKCQNNLFKVYTSSTQYKKDTYSTLYMQTDAHLAFKIRFY